MELSAALNNKIYFGSNSESLLSGSIQSLAPMLCVAITFKKSAQTHIVQTQLVGDYNLANILAAACIGEYFKVPEQEIVAAIAGYTPTNNRSQIMQTANNELIMDAYNANPSSMFAAVNNFQQLPAPNKYLILGDMFELGEESIAEHQAIVSLVAELKFEKVIFVGKDFYQAAAENKIASFQFFESTANASDYLSENSISAHTILIKGSRGMKLESLLPLL
jgi:UDP-N-acetylmuramoyl-tripeptide--D-alanyl-D-alanine ligase